MTSILGIFAQTNIQFDSVSWVKFRNDRGLTTVFDEGRCWAILQPAPVVPGNRGSDAVQERQHRYRRFLIERLTPTSWMPFLIR